MRLEVEKGRVVEFKCSKRCMQIGVVVDFITQSSFVIQLVCAQTGKALEREVMSKRDIVLMPVVIELNDSESVRGALFDSSVEINIKEAVKMKQATEAYMNAVRTKQLTEMTDFERFLKETEAQIQEKILKGKGF